MPCVRVAAERTAVAVPAATEPLRRARSAEPTVLQEAGPIGTLRRLSCDNFLQRGALGTRSTTPQPRALAAGRPLPDPPDLCLQPSEMNRGLERVVNLADL